MSERAGRERESNTLQRYAQHNWCSEASSFSHCPCTRTGSQCRPWRRVCRRGAAAAVTADPPQHRRCATSLLKLAGRFCPDKNRRAPQRLCSPRALRATAVALGARHAAVYPFAGGSLLLLLGCIASGVSAPHSPPRHTQSGPPATQVQMRCDASIRGVASEPSLRTFLADACRSPAPGLDMPRISAILVAQVLMERTLGTTGIHDFPRQVVASPPSFPAVPGRGAVKQVHQLGPEEHLGKNPKSTISPSTSKWELKRSSSGNQPGCPQEGLAAKQEWVESGRYLQDRVQICRNRRTCVGI